MASTQRQNLTGKKSFGQTMRQGAKVLGGQDVPSYTLVYDSPTKNRRSGEYESIVMPYIEVGRAADCVVRYGDEYPTVSRKHAAIRLDQGRVMVKHLGSNPTYITRANGMREQLTMPDEERELMNGDSLEFSSGGPKLRFNSTQTNTSTMGFTKRLQLFSQQALRPYRYAVWGLASLLILSSGVAGKALYGNMILVEEFKDSDQDGVIDKYDECPFVKGEYAHTGCPAPPDSDGDLIPDSKDKCPDKPGLATHEGCPPPPPPNPKDTDKDGVIDKYDKCPTTRGEFAYNGCPPPLDSDRDGIPDKNDKCPNKPGISKFNGCPFIDDNDGPDNDGPVVGPKFPVKKFENDVYFIRIKEMRISNGDLLTGWDDTGVRWSGTGFMTKNGKFITARHVLQGWRWLTTCDDMMTKIINNADMKKNLIVTYEAVSKSGQRFTFTNERIVKNDSKDYTVCDGQVKVIDYTNNGSTDWAYYPKGNLSSDITINRNTSKNIPQTETLHVLGYTSGMRLQNSLDKLDPIYDRINTTNQIEVKGMLLANAGNISEGCSGAPIFRYKDGKYEVIGILSGGNEAGKIARIVPIYNIE